MKITTEEVRQIASLAKLELTDSELHAMAGDLGSILEHTKELAGVDLGGVAPLWGVADHAAPLRTDDVGADPLERPIHDFAPAWEESFFVVPRLAALDAEASGKAAS